MIQRPAGKGAGYRRVIMRISPAAGNRPRGEIPGHDAADRMEHRGFSRLNVAASGSGGSRVPLSASRDRVIPPG
jgi:hypothetical protein